MTVRLWICQAISLSYWYLETEMVIILIESDDAADTAELREERVVDFSRTLQVSL
jgi:hypothetical protein